MMIDVEPDHAAYDDPEWAADAAAGALAEIYGLAAAYSEVVPVGPDVGVPLAKRGDLELTNRSYRFTITFHVDSDHPAFDDPEWAADAAHGALTNEYGIETMYADVRLAVKE